jgi:hypothetical protein
VGRALRHERRRPPAQGRVEALWRASLAVAGPGGMSLAMPRSASPSGSSNNLVKPVRDSRSPSGRRRQSSGYSPHCIGAWYRSSGRDQNARYTSLCRDSSLPSPHNLARLRRTALGVYLRGRRHRCRALLRAQQFQRMPRLWRKAWSQEQPCSTRKTKVRNAPPAVLR